MSSVFVQIYSKSRDGRYAGCRYFHTQVVLLRALERSNGSCNLAYYSVQASTAGAGTLMKYGTTTGSTTHGITLTFGLATMYHTFASLPITFYCRIIRFVKCAHHTK
jgi:hypothetical protein